jgi:two-component system chemotaxis response regulator CheB
VTIKVLIVDDSSFYQKRLAHLITEDPRMTVAAVAANGKEALELIVRHQPDVITLDLEMPVMGGIEAMKRIKSITKAPVLMLSTWTTEGAKATLEALEAGATDFMAKRFEDLTSQSGNTSKLCEQIYSMVTQRHATHSHVAKKAIQATTPPTNSAPKKNKFSRHWCLNGWACCCSASFVSFTGKLSIPYFAYPTYASGVHTDLCGKFK